MKRAELRKHSSFFSLLPNCGKNFKYALKCCNLELLFGAGDCELACRVVVAGYIFSKYPSFSLVKLQNFYLCLQIPGAESYLPLFLDVIHCFPPITC